ncbi:hypothetical protein GH810_02855 [Acetobacterium paludosum]|uniref:DUF1492 domain-containing protein n=1 Tax=Acetobacterium paludosum TaxID=52693 RepID=A0A923HR56_9FIRM|nr:hypothetical protein [Acetobacterium paludosum]MBC3887249.1 hypothetical protein [Acetobacterium paludosum]
MRKENKDIKQRLEDYQWICFNLELTGCDLERWMNEAKKVMSGMPIRLDTKDLRATYLDICEKLNAKIKEAAEEKIIVEEAIRSIDNYDIEQVMWLKYIEFLSWTEISNKTNHSNKYCHELHEKGLELLEYVLPEIA